MYDQVLAVLRTDKTQTSAIMEASPVPSCDLPHSDSCIQETEQAYWNLPKYIICMF